MITLFIKFLVNQQEKALAQKTEGKNGIYLVSPGGTYGSTGNNYLTRGNSNQVYGVTNNAYGGSSAIKWKDVTNEESWGYECKEKLDLARLGEKSKQIQCSQTNHRYSHAEEMCVAINEECEAKMCYPYGVNQVTGEKIVCPKNEECPAAQSSKKFKYFQNYLLGNSKFGDFWGFWVFSIKFTKTKYIKIVKNPTKLKQIYRCI